MRFLLVFLLFPISSFCQLSIDDIKNDEDAVKFVESYGRKHNMHWEKVGVNIADASSMRYVEKDNKQFIDSLTKNKWVKADFNNDRKTDLIFSGKINYQFAALSFISQKGDSISCQYLGSIFATDYPNGIETYKSNGLNLLLINSINWNVFGSDIRKNYHLDTLIYKLDGFAEFNRAADGKFNFDSIVYVTISNWIGIIQVPKMVVSADGTIKLYRNNYAFNTDATGWTNNLYVSNIDSEAIEGLKTILTYINFSHLQSEYELKNISDLTIAKTGVYYNGTMKEISDYGMHGTYGLSLLYKMLEEIKTKSLPALK